MTPADRTKYKGLYVQTSRQYLESIENALAELQEKQTDETIKELFIAAHSLKGQSLMIGYNQIGEYSSLIQELLEKKVPLDPPLLQKLNEGIQKITESLEEIEDHDTELDISEEIQILQEKVGKSEF